MMAEKSPNEMDVFSAAKTIDFFPPVQIGSHD